MGAMAPMAPMLPTPMLYSPIMFVFVDETGADHRNTYFRGERVSAISCMSVYGVLDVKMIRTTSDGDIFRPDLPYSTPNAFQWNKSSFCSHTGQLLYTSLCRSGVNT